jgi:tetratricopeptide (TPR) repeat protein
MITSFGFWWVAMVAIDNAILGVALFEIFHDVQYLAIAWVFSRNRIAKGHELNAFSRFLFRPDRAMIGLYVTLVLLYGYAIHLPGWVESDVLRRSLLGLVATSALLHFYYDGFIWKVRERTTREGLGLEGGGAEVSSRIHQGLGHVLKWSLFVFPLAGLAISQLQGPAPALAQRQNIVDAVPSAYTRDRLGTALLEAGRPRDAAPEFRAAIALDAGDWEHHEGLGAALAATGDLDAAIVSYERALEIDPTRSRVHSKLAYALGASGRHLEAVPWLEQVARRKQSWDAAYNLGMALAATGRSDTAVAQFQLALERNPEASKALRALAAELRKRGEHAQAARHLERARELERREAAVSS